MLHLTFIYKNGPRSQLCMHMRACMNLHGEQEEVVPLSQSIWLCVTVLGLAFS